MIADSPLADKPSQLGIMWNRRGISAKKAFYLSAMVVLAVWVMLG